MTPPPGGLKDAALSSLRWVAATKTAAQLFSWVGTLLVMRQLLPADYGLLAMAMIVVGLSTMISDLGLGSSIVQAKHVEPRRLRGVAGLAMLIATTIFVLLAAAAPWFARFFAEPRLTAIIMVVGTTIPLAAMASVPEAMMRRTFRFKELGVIEAVAQLVAVLTTVVLARLGAGVWALAAGIVGQLLAKTLAVVWRGGFVPPSLDGLRDRHAMRFGLSLTANRLMWYFFSKADVFLAGKWIGKDALGAYTTAMELASLPIQKISGISNSVAMSAFSRLQDTPDARDVAVSRSLAVAFALSAGLIWGLGATAADVVPAVLGAQWTAAVVPLQILAVAMPLRVPGALLSTAAIASGRLDLDMENLVFANIVLLPAFAAGIAYGGIEGLAWAWTLGYPITIAMLVKRLHTGIGMRPAPIVAALWPTAAAGAVMVATIVLVRASLAEASVAVRIAASVVAGAASFVLALTRLDRDVIVGMRQIVSGRGKLQR